MVMYHGMNQYKSHLTLRTTISESSEVSRSPGKKHCDFESETAAGSEILHQLRLVVFAIICKAFTSQVVQEFFHQQYG